METGGGMENLLSVVEREGYCRYLHPLVRTVEECAPGTGAAKFRGDIRAKAGSLSVGVRLGVSERERRMRIIWIVRPGRHDAKDERARMVLTRPAINPRNLDGPLWEIPE